MNAVAAWESGGADAPCGGEGWAQFGADAFPPPADPFARSADEGAEAPAPPAPAAGPPADPEPFPPFWPSAEREAAAAPADAADAGDAGDAAASAGERLDVAEGVRSLRLEQFGSERERSAAAELASNLLSAMSGMAPDLIANIVNANISPLHLPQPPAPPSPPPPPPEAPGDGTRVGDESTDS